MIVAQVAATGADAGPAGDRLLQDAAERGDLDPWDVDVIAVIDGFLDQLRQRIEVPGRSRPLWPAGGSYEQDWPTAAKPSGRLRAGGLKAEMLETSMLPPPRSGRSLRCRIR